MRDRTVSLSLLVMGFHAPDDQDCRQQHGAPDGQLDPLSAPVVLLASGESRIAGASLGKSARSHTGRRSSPFPGNG